LLGSNNAGISLPAVETVVRNNKFKGLRPQFGTLAIFSARSLVVESNTFEDISGNIVNYLSDVTAGSGRYLEGIRITNNLVTNRLNIIMGRPAGTFIQSAGGINTGFSNSYINSTNVESGNVMLHGSVKYGAGILTIAKDQVVTDVPRSGTWEISNRLNLRIPSERVSYIFCLVSGTFGTLSATGDAKKGSSVLLNVKDGHFSLREGQYIKISGDSAIHQIKTILGTTVYLDSAFSGETNLGVPLLWSPPQFVIN
jgi:hypothetical protein